MADSTEALDRGARNLLLSCAGAKAGDRLLILCEGPSSSYVDAQLAPAIADVARSVGLAVDFLEAPFHPDVEALSEQQEAAVRASDHVLFLSRLGEQIRFKFKATGNAPIVSHALDAAAFASAFCTASYDAFVDLKSAFNDLLHGAGEIRVTCPLGTDFAGVRAGSDLPAVADVTIKRFPMCIFAPVPADRFSGTVAVAHLIVGTGSRYYSPYGLRLGSPLRARVANGRIVDWEGCPREVGRVRSHYDHVAGLFGLDGAAIHSWHAGIHPGCAYVGSACDNFERWTNSAFGNPRLLHFHTCGDYPPGEICWNVVDPTVEVDHVRIWDRGRIVIDAVPGATAILDRHPEVRALFENPVQEIGIGDDT